MCVCWSPLTTGPLDTSLSKSSEGNALTNLVYPTEDWLFYSFAYQAHAVVVS